MAKPSDYAIATAFAEVLRDDPTFKNRMFRWHVAANRILIRAAEIEVDSRAPVQASEARGDLVLVPRTLTLEMYSAWCEANGEGVSFHLVQAQWAAMLAAAPDSAHTQAGPVG